MNMSLHCPETFIRSSIFNSLIDTYASSLSALSPNSQSDDFFLKPTVPEVEVT